MDWAELEMWWGHWGIQLTATASSSSRRFGWGREAWMGAKMIFFFLNHIHESQSQQSPAFRSLFLQLSSILDQDESGMKSSSIGSLPSLPPAKSSHLFPRSCILLILPKQDYLNLRLSVQTPELSQWLFVTGGHVEAFIFVRPARILPLSAPRPSGRNRKLLIKEEKRGGSHGAQGRTNTGVLKELE